MTIDVSDLLPPDDSAFGFDNIGDALFAEPLSVAFDNSIEDNDSLVAAVDEIVATEARLDVLVDNAGAIEPKRRLTEDGLVPLAERDSLFGRFMSGMTYHWHASGRLVELEEKWGVSAAAPVAVAAPSSATVPVVSAVMTGASSAPSMVTLMVWVVPSVAV